MPVMDVLWPVQRDDDAQTGLDEASRAICIQEDTVRDDADRPDRRRVVWDERVPGDRSQQLDRRVEQERLPAVQLDPEIEVAECSERAHPLLEPTRIEGRSFAWAGVDVAVRALQVATPADEEDDR